MAGLPGYDVTYLPPDEAMRTGLGKARPKGVPAIDRISQRIQGLANAPKPGIAQRVVRTGVPLATLAAIGDSAAGDATARYAKRFGVQEPTGDGSPGDIAKFAALRAGGFASDLGNAMTFGAAERLYRDTAREPTPGIAAIPKAQASGIASIQPTSKPMPGIEATTPPVKSPSLTNSPTNPATPEQQAALSTMGITQDRVLNPGAGVDLKTANAIERRGRNGGEGGRFTQLAGYGDQNSVYGRASKPGGKINEFFGAGTGKPSSPGSIPGLNVVPADTGTSGAGIAAALNAAADRGDWNAVEGYYANRGQDFAGGKRKGLAQAGGADFTGLLERKYALKEAESGREQGRLDMEREKFAFDRGVANTEQGRKARIDSLTDSLLNARTPQEQSAAAQKIALLSGNLPKPPATKGYAHATRKTTDEMGNTIEEPYIYSQDTGQPIQQTGQAKPQLQNVTQADITATAKKYGISEAEVKKRLGI